MQSSTERILTTHVGSLARPHDLLEVMREKEHGRAYDPARFTEMVTEAVRDVVRGQAEAGLDVVTDGEQALQFLRRTGGYADAPRPGLILLDLNLPDVDGWEVCRRIKAEPRTASVIVLQVSATYIHEEDTVRSLEAGADFVKTSTGFSSGGATAADVALMRRAVGGQMGVKASGGVRDLKQAQEMIQAGATRIGASVGVKIMQEAAGSPGAAAGQLCARAAEAGAAPSHLRIRGFRCG